MKRIRKLIFPLFIFLIFLSLVIFKDHFLSGIEPASDTITKKFIYYALQIGLWISGAHLLNVLTKIFFWDAIVAKTIRGTVPRLLTHFFSLIVYIITITFIIGSVFDRELTGVWATSGVMALILGFALRNMILDLFTGLAVNIEMPYKIGDWIEINTNNPKPDINGEVIDINWRATRLRDEEQRVVIIPNSLISTYIVTNYSQPRKSIRFETIVRLDSSVPVGKAKRIILAAAKEVLNQEGFYKDPEPNVVANETNEFGVEYKIRYWINPWKGIYPTSARDLINSSILKYLSFSGLKPSFPNENVYYSKSRDKIVETGSLEYKRKLLRQINLFNSLEEEELTELAGKIDEKTYSKGENLITVGDQGESMFILYEGLLEVRVNIENGSSHKVGEIYPGQFFGEMSLLTGEPRSATISAATDIVAFEIKREHVEDLFKKRPTIMEDISKVVALRTRENSEAIESISNMDDIDSMNSFAQNLLGKIKTFFY